MGIDGGSIPSPPQPCLGKDTSRLAFMGVWYPVQVKQKDKVGRRDIDAFEALMARVDRAKSYSFR